MTKTHQLMSIVVTIIAMQAMPRASQGASFENELEGISLFTLEQTKDDRQNRWDELGHHADEVLNALNVLHDRAKAIDQQVAEAYYSCLDISREAGCDESYAISLYSAMNQTESIPSVILDFQLSMMSSLSKEKEGRDEAALILTSHHSGSSVVPPI